MNSEKYRRKLTAVLSADVVGYSRLMRDNEASTVETITAYREIISELIEQHRGRVVDSTGDNLLAEYVSVVDAVRCAVQIQEDLKVRNEELPSNRRMEFRIGINTGDVIQEGDRIYGDGVNVAARIESLADAGGICISRSAYDQVEGKLNFRYEYQGEHQVKNIDKPVRVYKVLMESESEELRHEEKILEPVSDEWKASSMSAKPSIAVLPFVNMSNDPEQEYFSDGITEELISALAKLEDLKVISRTSAFCFKGKDIDLRTIGEKLNVDNVVEGSVRRAGNKLKITAQLIKVADDSHLWAETFDREMIDVFAIQEEISRAIVDKLKVKLLGEEKRALTKSGPKNLEAYDYYLRGLFFMGKGGPGWFKAKDYFEKAVSIDPNFALPYAQLAGIYAFSAYFAPMPPKVSYPKAKAMAMKALEIDNTIPEAYISLGIVKMAYEYDWNGAEKALKRAIELNPGHARARHYYSMLLLSTGPKSEALDQNKYALELDPLSIHINNNLGLKLTIMGQHDQAIQQLQKTLEMAPNDSLVIGSLGLAFTEKGMHEKAIEILEKGVDVFPKSTFLISTLGYAYGVAGKKDKAQEILNELLERRKQSYFSSNLISRIYAGMDDKDKAFEWLYKAYEERDPTVAPIKSVPSAARLRSDPRWAELMEKMGLAD